MATRAQSITKSEFREEMQRCGIIGKGEAGNPSPIAKHMKGKVNA